MGTHRYRTYLLSGLSAAILLPLTALLIFAGFFHRNTTAAWAMEKYGVALEAGAFRIQSLLEAPQSHFRLLSGEFNQDQNWRLLRQRMAELQKEFPYLVHLEVLDRTGKILFTQPEDLSLEGVNRADTVHVRQALETRTPYYSDSFLSPETGGAAAAFTLPFPEFTVYCQISLGKFGLDLNDDTRNLFQDYSFSLTDSRGNFLFDRDMDRVYRKETYLGFRDVLNLEPRDIRFLWNQTDESLVMEKVLEPQNWHLLLIRTNDQVFGVMANFHLFAWSAMILAVLSVGLFSLRWSRWMTGYLTSLEKAFSTVVVTQSLPQLPENPVLEVQALFRTMETVMSGIRTREEEFHRQMEELENKKVELERFIYTVSHDLKSPLITIRGFLGHLRVDWAQDREARFEEDVRRIDNAADRMQQLLEDLLHLSGTAEGSERIQAFKMHSAFRSALSSLSETLPAESLRVPSDPWPEVQADYTRITVVWKCLLENSQKFRSLRPLEIEAGWLVQEGRNVFFLRDNGKGVPPAYQKKIFGLFEKLDPSSSGSGLGLPLAKRIIEQHRGRIWMESQGEDCGSTFYFTLPSPEVPH